ncbi:MAG: YceI family protein [Candidatus Paceibacterota bacterium]
MVVILVLVVVVLVVGYVFLNQNSSNMAKVNMPESPAPASISSELENGTYTFQSSKSKIMWAGKKTLVAEWIDEGLINLSTGSLVVENGGISSGSVVVDMNTITAQKTGSGGGQDKLVAHLKSADFFDVAKFGNSVFNMSSIVKNGDMYQVTGDLTIKGKMEKITFPANIYMGDGKVFVEAEIVVDRSKFDVRFGSKSFFNDLGNNIIDDNFTLKMKLVGTK